MLGSGYWLANGRQGLPWACLVQIDFEIQANEMAGKELKPEVDDGAAAVASDAPQLGCGRGFLHTQPARKLEVGFADGERLLDLALVGVVRSQTLEHRSVARSLILQFAIKPALDEQIGQRNRIWIVLVMVKMHDAMVAGTLPAFLGANRQGSAPRAAVDFRNRDGGRVRLEFIEIEREREPASIERLGDDGTAAPVAVPGDQALLREQIQGMPNGNAPDVELLHEGIEGRQAIAGLPFTG